MQDWKPPWLVPKTKRYLIPSLVYMFFLTHSHTHSTWSGYGSGYVEWVWSGYKMKKWSGYKMGWSGYEMWYFSNLEWVWEWVSRTHNEKIYFLYLYYFVCKDLIIRSQNIDNFVSYFIHMILHHSQQLLFALGITTSYMEKVLDSHTSKILIENWWE